MTVQTVLDYLWTLAPATYKMSWDNVGLLLGRAAAPVHRILVSLDLTLAVAEEADRLGCELIVTHHPAIFKGDRHITDLDPLTGPELFCLERRIAVISMHTNLDCAPGGVNDVLAEQLDLHNIEPLFDGTDPALIRMGLTEPTDLRTFAAFVKERLGCAGLRFADAGRPVRRVAVGGGSCIELAELALAAGCDTFVTGDVKYHQFLDTAARGLNLIDAGHFPTEDPVCRMLLEKLAARFPEAELFKSCRTDPVRWL